MVEVEVDQNLQPNRVRHTNRNVTGHGADRVGGWNPISPPLLTLSVWLKRDVPASEPSPYASEMSNNPRGDFLLRKTLRTVLMESCSCWSSSGTVKHKGAVRCVRAGSSQTEETLTIIIMIIIIRRRRRRRPKIKIRKSIIIMEW